MPQTPVIFTRLTRWDWLLLANFLADTFGDFFVQSTLILFLSDNLGASDGLAAAMLGAVAVFEALIMTFAGRILDTWPEDAPLLAMTYLKPVGAVALVCLLVVDLALKPYAGTRPSQALALFILLTIYAPAEVLGSLAHLLTVKRICEYRDDKAMPVLRPALYLMSYAVQQAGAILAYLGTTACRGWAGAAHPDLANRLVLGASAILFCVAATGAYWVNKALLTHDLLVPRVKPARLLGWRAGIDDAFDMCACDCSARYCKKMGGFVG
jgi:hypothetical protein